MALVAPAPTPVSVANGRRVILRAIPVYWHLLSLDAPTLAVLWAWALARTAALHVTASTLAVLGLGAWLIYIADRLLDGRPGSRHLHLRDRHFFHARHRRALLAAGAFASIPLLWLIAVMPSAARRDDALVFAVAMLYFAIVHLRAPGTRRGYPRELTVSLVFAAATAVPAWSRSAAPVPALAWPVLVFAALCCVNCIAIEHWERPAPRKSASHSRLSPISLMAGLAALAFIALLLASAIPVPYAAVALASALLLLFLDQLRLRARRPPSQLAMRIAADAALLTPLLLLVPWAR